MGKIDEIAIEETMKNSYLDYSMSVILGRALPDIRDGLKPVHRRIIYAMNELHLSHRRPFKKSARIVGDVIGKYHPHGDNSVYDALVRLGQGFSMSVPLVEGQGNFGSIDGDNAAAMRYTEARLSMPAKYLLEELSDEVVDYQATYDDSDLEPTVLPASIPLILINGGTGIAVGMSTAMPPHNITSVIDATIALIDNPLMTIDELAEILVAPDFPTGGVIYGRQGILDAYRTGKGKIKLRAKAVHEIIDGKECIIVDEIPYLTNKSKIVESISRLVKEKIIIGITDIRDESDRDGIRIVITVKKGHGIDIVENALYKHTQLQTTFSVANLAVIKKEPKLLNLKEIMNEFISFRKTTVIRITISRLEVARKRLEILKGLNIAIANIDDVINITKQSETDEIAKLTLRAKYDLSIVQVSAILDMRIRRLVGLERTLIEKEIRELEKLISKLTKLLSSDRKLSNFIIKELKTIMKDTITMRRTEVVDDYGDINIEDLIPNDPMVISLTHKGYIKRVPSNTYESQHRGGTGKTAVVTYDDDAISEFIVAKAHDTLLFVTNLGRLHKLKVYEAPEASRTAKGKALVNLIELVRDEVVVGIIPVSEFNPNHSILFTTRKGRVKRTSLSEFTNIRKPGIKAITLKEGDSVIKGFIVKEETKWALLISKLGNSIRFPISGVRTMGRTAEGVYGLKFKIDGDSVVDATLIRYN